MRVLVTGASRGIGRAVALALAARGARLALVARDATLLTRVAGETRAPVAIAADLARSERVEALVDHAVSVLGGLDALVNCAGLVRYAAVGGIAIDELQQQLAVNFVAPFLLAQRAAWHMRENEHGGSIVNVASTLGQKPAPSTAVYAATKAALISMTQSFALELGPRRIRVNAVAPGVIDTDMVRVVRPSFEATSGGTDRARIEQQLGELRQLHLVQRLGTPEDVAASVLYLLDAEFVSGSVLVVDGGLSLA